MLGAGRLGRFGGVGVGFLGVVFCCVVCVGLAGVVGSFLGCRLRVAAWRGPGRRGCGLGRRVLVVILVKVASVVGWIRLVRL